MQHIFPSNHMLTTIPVRPFAYSTGAIFLIFCSGKQFAASPGEKKSGYNNRMRKRHKIFLLLAVFTGVVIIASLVLYFAAARLVNTETVKEKLRVYFLEKTGAEVRYGSSELFLFPLPEIIFRKVDVAIPGKAQGSVESVRIYPGLWALIRGDLRIAKLGLEAPRFTVAIMKEKEKPSLEAIEEKLRTLSRYVVATSPGLTVAIRNGRLNLTESDEIAFSFDMIRSRLSVSRKTLEVSLTGRSNLWDNLSFSAALAADDLKSEGSVRITRLHPDILLTRLTPKTAEHIGIAEADLSVKFRSLGLRQVEASAESTVPGLTVSRKNRQVTLKDAKIKGDIGIEPKKVSVLIKEVNIGQPALKLSVQYTLDRDSGSMTAGADGKSINVRPVRDSALTLAGDIPVISTIFDYLRDGQIPALHFHTSGKALSDLGRTENIRVSGKLLGGTIHVAARDLTFQNVAGEVDISRGILEGSNVRASMGNNRCSKGELRIGLKGKDAPFHIDLHVRADAGALPPLIRDKKLVKNEAFLREMGRLHDLRGTAEGRLILGERLDSIHVKIAADDMDIKTRYEPLPFSLAVTGGKFFFDEKSIQVEDLGGSIGGSSFSRLSGSLGLASPYDVEITGGQMLVSADELYPWITSFEEIKPVLNTVRSIKGLVAFSSVTFRGPLYESGKWQFREEGEARRVKLDASFLPGKAEEITGTFVVTQSELSLKDIRSKILDSLITVTGTFNNFPADIRSIDLSLKGDVGPEVLPWITALAKIPHEIKKLHAPFSVTDAAVSWEKDKKTKFDGNLLFNGDTKVSLSLTKTPDALAVHKAAVKDRKSDAAARLILDKETLDVSFRGNVAADTLHTIFTDSIFSDAALEGDFLTHIVIEHPQESTAQGKLKGKNIPIPWNPDMPLVVQHIALEAKEHGIVIDTAEITAGDMKLKAKGTVSRQPSWYAVDMDVSSDGIDLNTIEDIIRKETPEIKRKKSGILKDVPVRGTLRVMSDFLRYRQFNLKPFHADVTFDGKTALIKVNKAALCEVSATGDVSVTEQGIKLGIALSAKDLAFRPTILCLTDKNADYTGTFNMEASLKGEGTIGELVNSLNGTFHLRAKDGKILKSKSINKTLDLLNESENLKGEFPDIEKEIVGYRVLNARGSLQGQMLHIEEGVLDASVMGIMARGSVDIGNETLDINALVAPLKAVHRIVSKIPILGHILGGNLVSVPVKISGDLKDPQVTFLSPSAVGSEFLGIVERTLKLPITLIEPIFPKKEGE